jgi:hypothetical protein
MENEIAEKFNKVKDDVVDNESHREGPMARAIEQKTAKLPSDIFLWAALGSMGASLTLQCLGKKNNAQFLGQWAAPFLLLGLYNKVVKVAGHDKEDRGLSSQEPFAR